MSNLMSIMNEIHTKGMKFMEGKEYPKSSRILCLYSELVNEGLVKKSEAAKRFRVTEKSIQRDLDEIRDFLDNQTAEEGIRKYLIYD